MTIMKDKLVEILRNKSLTINEMAQELGLDDDMIIIAMITELEINRKVKTDGFNTCYEPNGSPFYIARYSLV